MKRITWIGPLTVSSLLAFASAGCKKQAGATQTPQTLDQAVDQFRESLVNPSPNVQSNFYVSATYSIRYGKYGEALGAMDQIANDPSLNDRQKKAASNVIEQLKVKVQEQQNPPASTQ
jgi:hypothetical protein